MKPSLVGGLVLVLSGAAILAYGHFSYHTRETVLEIGSFKATAEKTKTVPLPSGLGWALIAGGACVVIFSARSKK